MSLETKICRLSYAIMTHNEELEFNLLMDSLEPFLIENSEVVVVDDFSNPCMVGAIKRRHVNFFQRALNRNFAEQRNFTKSQCKGEFIFVLDPDESPAPHLLSRLPEILGQMERENLDGCILPRFNKIIESDGTIDPSTINISQADIIKSPPEDQLRIYRNTADIMWVNPLHESLKGINRALRLPNTVDYGIFHVKTKKRSIAQVEFYNSINSKLDNFIIDIKFRLIKLFRKINLLPIIQLITRPRITEVAFKE